MRTATTTIRPAVEQDLAEIVRIEQASFADPWSRESFLSSLAQPRMRFVVAEESSDDDGSPPERSRLLGYVLAIVLSDEGEIVDLAVDPPARRHGTGGLLLDWIIRDAMDRDVQTLYLEVRESNTGARELYSSRGFEPVGRRRGYYQRPSEDAVLMRRALGSDLM